MVSFQPAAAAASASGSARVSERVGGRHSTGETASATASELSPALAGMYYICGMCVCVWSTPIDVSYYC